MSTGLQSDGARPAPPFGTSQRIRNRAIWAVALFAAAVPPAIVGLGIAQATDDQVQRRHAASPSPSGRSALLLRAMGRLPHPALLGWPAIQTRWLGALPLLSVSLFAERRPDRAFCSSDTLQLRSILIASIASRVTIVPAPRPKCACVTTGQAD